ncbi:OTU domain-containing protein [Balamuthia mandrillaris]
MLKSWFGVGTQGLRSDAPSNEEQEHLDMALALSLSAAISEQKRRHEKLEEEETKEAVQRSLLSQQQQQQQRLEAFLKPEIPSIQIEEEDKDREWEKEKEKEKDKNNEKEQQQQHSNHDTEHTQQSAETEDSVSHRRRHLVSSMPNTIRKSLERLQESGDDDAAIAQVLAHENALLGPENLSMGDYFDRKIQNIVCALGLKKSTLAPKVNDEQSLRQVLQVQRREEFRKARQRLKKRLKLYGLAEYPVAGDGNCQFSSISDQLYTTPKLNSLVRSVVVKQLRENPQHYSRFVPGDYHKYCDKMAKKGEWGDHLTLQAAADKFGIQINLITSYKDTPCFEIEPREKHSSRILWLSFFGELHYNSLYRQEDLEYRENMDKFSKEDCVLF